MLLNNILCCGVYHAFMPIVVEAVSLEKYLSWLDSQV